LKGSTAWISMVTNEKADENQIRFYEYLSALIREGGLFEEL
jgi:hypothetical protein